MHLPVPLMLMFVSGNATTWYAWPCLSCGHVCHGGTNVGISCDSELSSTSAIISDCMAYLEQHRFDRLAIPRRALRPCGETVSQLHAGHATPLV